MSFNPQQPGQYPPHGQPSFQPPRPRRRHTGLVVTGIIIGAIFVLIGIGALASAGKPAAPAAPSSPAAAAAKSSSPAAPELTYVVTGAPDADVTYGPAGSGLTGHVPMRVTARLGSAAYYSVDAQLNGSGSVTVEILVGGKVISSGRASGGYNVATAEITQDPLTGKWENAQ